MIKRASVVTGLILSAALACMQAYAAEPATSQPLKAFTKPSQEITISFNHPGRITKLMVKEGDLVKAGQQVAQLDDSEEQAALAVAKAQAEDDTRTEAQLEVEAHKKQVYENKKNAGGGAGEVAEALLDWKVGSANVKLSRFEHDQDARKAKQNEAALEKTRLYTSIDGRVEEILKKAGENVEGQEMKVMRIVNIDPLWADVAVPQDLASSLKQNDPCTVKFANGETRTGKIVLIKSVGDAASGTLPIRVEVPNSAKTPAGGQVTVSFTPGNKVAAGEGNR